MQRLPPKAVFEEVNAPRPKSLSAWSAPRAAISPAMAARSSCTLLKNYTKNGAIHFVCMDWRHVDELLAAGREVYTELKNIVVWVKSTAGMGSLYRSQHELICVFKSGTGRHINNIELGKNGRNRTNVWEFGSAGTQARKGNNVMQLHPTLKPVQLVIEALLDCSNRGDIVLDCFLGSGTTLLAAGRTGSDRPGCRPGGRWQALPRRRSRKGTG
jgi:hypothetical protein